MWRMFAPSVCAYANPQWELSKVMSANLEESCFYKPRQIALEKNGVVLLVFDDAVLDDDGQVVSGPAKVFTRIYEESKALELGMYLDVGAVADKKVQMLT